MEDLLRERLWESQEPDTINKVPLLVFQGQPLRATAKWLALSHLYPIHFFPQGFLHIHSNKFEDYSPSMQRQNKRVENVYIYPPFSTRGAAGFHLFRTPSGSWFHPMKMLFSHCVYVLLDISSEIKASIEKLNFSDLIMILQQATSVIFRPSTGFYRRRCRSGAPNIYSG